MADVNFNVPAQIGAGQTGGTPEQNIARVLQLRALQSKLASQPQAFPAATSAYQPPQGGGAYQE